jgi:uncharacterized membrane protein YeaQ/YmgE (transglycosylase-associated protein family)
MLYLVWVVLIGILAGWLAGQITKGSGFGLAGDLIGIVAYGLLGRLVMAVIGAIVLLWLIRVIKRS